MAFTIELRQGTTLIATRTPTLTTSLATFEFDLTAPERAAITNWSTLRLHFIANTDQVSVSWAEFAVPGAGGVGSSTGRGTATGVSSTFLGLQAAVGSAAGTSVATAGQLYKGVAAGLGTATAVGRAFVGGRAVSAGSSAATAPTTGGTVTAAVGTSIGWCQVFGVPGAAIIVGINAAVGRSQGGVLVLASSLRGNHLTIDGVEYAYLIEGFSINETYHGANTLQCVIQYATLPIGTPFQRGDEIIVTENGTRIFAGYLDSVDAHGIGGEVPNSIEYNISASDYEALAEYRFVIDGGFPEGFTLKQAFTDTMAFLQPYGVSVDRDQEVGPTLPLLLYDLRSIREVWDEFSEITGYIWTIDYHKQASFRVPGALQAPFNVGFSQSSFIGAPHRFLIQQMEYYNYLDEGDPRLRTWFYTATGVAYNAGMDTLDSYNATIITNMSVAERSAFEVAFLSEYHSGRFEGEDINFLIQQAEYYNYVPENDPRFKTWLSAYTITTYEAGIAYIESYLNGVINAMQPDERAAFNGAYNDATIAGRIAATDQLGDIEVEPAKIDYANRVIVRFGTGAKEIEDKLGGPTPLGQKAFPLTYSNVVAHRGYITLNNVYETLSIGGGGTWDYDPKTNIVTRLTAPLPSSNVVFTYTTQFPQSAIATAWTEIEERPLKEVVLPEPEIFILETAQKIADAWLPRYVAQPRSAHYTTRRAGIHPGMLQDVSVPDRDFYQICFVSDVTITATEYGFLREVSVMEGAFIQGSWRDLYRLWSGGGGSGGGGGGGGIVLTTPPPTVGVGVTGSGIINAIPKWLNTTSLGDSRITDDGFFVDMHGPVTVTGDVSISGTYYGSAAGLTEIPANQLVGTIDDARLSTNVPLKNAENVFTQMNRFQTPIAGDAVQIRGRSTDETSVLGWYNSNSTNLHGKITGSGTTLTLFAANDLLLQPGGNVTVDPAGNVVIPATNYDISLGRLDRKFLMIHAAELWVETLVAQNTIATIGGRILVGPTTTLAADLAIASTTISVKHNQMVSGDIVYMEAFNGTTSQVEFMTVTSGPSGTGPYSYTVTRSIDPGTANAWLAGDAMFNTGQTGNGFIDLYSVRGVKSGTEFGPTIVGNVRTSSTYNAWSPRWAIGNLNGVFGKSTNIYGVAFGDPTATNIIIDEITGIQIRSGTTPKFSADTSGNLTLAGDLTVGTNGIVHSAGTTFANSVVGFHIEGGGTPKFRVGDPAGNQLKWDGNDLTVKASILTVDTTGVSMPSWAGASMSTLYGYRFGSPWTGTNYRGMFSFENGTMAQIETSISTTNSNYDVNAYLYAANGTAACYLRCRVDASNISFQTFVASGHSFGGNVFPTFDNLVACGVPSFRWTAVYAVNGAIQTSDERQKRNIRDDNSLGMDFVRQLRVRGFEYLDNPEYRLGFVAQEVTQTLAGRTFAAIREDHGILGLNYAGFVPVLTTALQELDRRVSALEGALHG